MNDNKGKNIQWYMLAVMAFSTVWGFGNIINGFVYFNGMQVIFSWIMMFGLYFIPYTLMVGELGSTFRHSGGGRQLLDPRDDRRKMRLLRRLDVLGLPCDIYCE